MNNRVNVLLVDDRHEGLVTLEAVLSNPKYNLVKAQSGREALAQVLQYDFAVILMDVQMPDIDGFETVSIIKQRDKSKNTPIIFLTAINKSDNFVSTGYAKGAVDYIFKPFDPVILSSKVAVFVDLYEKNKLILDQSEAIREIEKRERLRTLAELEQEGRRRYQNLADAIPLIVCKANELGKIEYFNQFWHRCTGLTLAQSVGDSWQTAIFADDLPELEKKWTMAVQMGQGFESECRIQVNRGNEYRWHLWRMVPELDNPSKLLGWLGTATDIHDQKLIHEELIKAKKMAETANETKSRFLANMSHEIRTPLGAILGFAELIMDPTTAKDEREESMAAILRNGNQLSRIIDEILDLSKVEADRMELEKNEVDLADLLAGVRTLLSMVAKEKGLNLNFDTQGNIPTKIFTDAGRLQQILNNVIGNAIKFSPKGEINVVVSWDKAVGKQPSRLKIGVKDSGPGLTKEQIKDLFQPFTQVDTSMTRKYGGTGLGLALSRRLARALGGDIVAEQNLNGLGCHFVITIATGPIDHVELTNTLHTSQGVLPESRKAIGAHILNDVKVLLVEDSADIQKLVSRLLSMAGAQVELANNGLEGVDQALKGNHDVVLMDIQMPELDGYGAIRQLREKKYTRPIIALTAHGMIEERIKCLQVGATDHMTKPVNREKLIGRVSELSHAN